MDQQNGTPRNSAPGGAEGENRNAGGFKLEIDERQLATGPVELPDTRKRRAGHGEPAMTRKIYYTEEERKKEEKAHRKRNRLKARKNKRVFSFVWLAMVLLVSFTLASYLIGGANDFFAVGRNQGTAEVEIPDKVSIEQLTELLLAKGIIAKPEFFQLYCKVTADEELFVGGRYQLDTNLDYEDIINRLQGGEENLESVRVTFPEGLTVLEIAALLEENEVCQAQDFLLALNEIDFSNYWVVAEMGEGSGKYYKLEGYLYPDTYDFYKGEELDSVIGKMLNNFGNRLSKEMKAQIESSSMSLDQIVTLASIIQAEAANSNDMLNVSAVLHNRLKFGADYGIFALECDSTIYYPYKRASDVPESGAVPHGNYTTYDNPGLPAGAICNPGNDALRAALNPSTEGDAPEYLYFCHAEDGTAYYATNESDHIDNQYAAGLMD